MLSILIPIFNVDVRKLIGELHEQCLKAKIVFEIICFDDFSETKYREKNRSLDTQINVSYIELSENRGRAKIRNLLGKNSRYDYLLFLDSDSKIPNKKFIKRYLPYLDQYDLINGGRIYKKKPPQSKRKVLHWKYGMYRESISAKKRNAKGSMYFHSNNFVIRREVFLQSPFDSEINGYGYEDLVFSEKLIQNGHSLQYIDNPVLHTQLKDTDSFLSDVDHSIKNLASLYYREKLMDTRLLRSYKKMNHYNLITLFEKGYQMKENKIKDSLYSDKPSLYNLDFYKLYTFVQQMKLLNASKNEAQ